MSHAPARQFVHERWGFAGSVAGSVAWMVSLLYEVQHASDTDRIWLCGAISGVLLAVLLVDLVIGMRTARDSTFTKTTFFRAICLVAVSTSAAAIAIEVICRPVFVRNQLRISNLMWVPAGMLIVLVFLSVQMVLSARSDTESDTRGDI